MKLQHVIQNQLCLYRTRPSLQSASGKTSHLQALLKTLTVSTKTSTVLQLEKAKNNESTLSLQIVPLFTYCTKCNAV